MIAEIDECQEVQVATLSLAALATVSAELALAEPGRPEGLSLAWASLWVVVALAAHLGPGRSRNSGVGPAPGRATTRPLLVIAILIAFAAPFIIEAARLMWLGRSSPMEIVMLAALRNLGLALAVYWPAGQCSRGWRLW